jgi:hypothetical protein
MEISSAMLKRVFTTPIKRLDMDEFVSTAGKV